MQAVGIWARTISGERMLPQLLHAELQRAVSRRDRATFHRSKVAAAAWELEAGSLFTAT
jgi:hypothetical protein